MKNEIIATELMKIAKGLLSYNEREEQITELEDYTGRIAKEILKIKSQGKIQVFRQGYKGTGAQRPRRQLNIKLENGTWYTVVLDMSSYRILSGSMLGLLPAESYGSMTPDVVAKQIVESINEVESKKA